MKGDDNASNGAVRADNQSEAGQMPSEMLLSEMGKFNEQLVEAMGHPRSELATRSSW
jgi:hypothetical protein